MAEWNDANQQHLDLLKEQHSRLKASGKGDSKMASKVQEEIQKMENMRKGGAQRRDGSFTTGDHTQDRVKQSPFGSRSWDQRAHHTPGDVFKRAFHEQARRNQEQARVMGEQAPHTGAIFGAAGVAHGEYMGHRRHSHNPYYYRTKHGKREKVKNHFASAVEGATTGGGAYVYAKAGSKGHAGRASLGYGALLGGIAGGHMYQSYQTEKAGRAEKALKKKRKK